MGQGHYVMIAWGQLNPPVIEDDINDRADIIYTAMLDAAKPYSLQSAYECEVSYYAVPVMVSDGCLEDDWHCIETKSGPLATVLRELELAPYQSAWQRVREAAARHGIELGEGELLILFDYA